MEPDDAYSLPSAPGQAIPGQSAPGLTLVATPIGNLGDLSARAAAALAGADAVLCEDTRVTSRLLARHSISAKMLALHDHNEESEAPRLVSRMLAGERFALVSDAGTPLVSDPGYRLVRAAIAAGVAVTAVPGPSAVVMALTLSGLPPHPFLFHGFLPPKAAARAGAIARIAAMEAAGLSASLVFYEAPHRTGEALAALAEGLGADRPACVARELTKRFEEVRRGSLAELAAHYASQEARGEVVLCVGPAPPAAESTAESLDESLRAAMATLSVRDAAATVAEATGLPRKRVYARALELAAGR
ncbi:16S rRNA (cytidine(1402)-2'-O)-methyltransferase [Roseococcus sp. SYP-B2431]|uniref:16S rRNA (cytidine(1402)-2'-O)-methyltransferase n=1 Tax=Roseococcus sp. SYP-B2431 TaxID=2496640 RepID=UPI001040CB9B|nr:16S rRNA (cytidine(1402)-2'-O)-methyltransferase [Roseococcus sp. SYP-B2431]TCH96175.1 16S rRNA (cytidine(1402)-2'-O)-methyltransferase [Roseococcus sp. SYP-B2431]